MTVSREFQNRFKECVELQGKVNKHQLANEMNIAYTIFSKAYNYGIVPKPIILMRIADFFNISVEYLLGKTDDEYFEKSKSPKTFHERLTYLRDSKNLTPSNLSHYTHIHRNRILQWDKYNYIPPLHDLTILADFFDVSLDYLLGRTDDDTPYNDLDGD